MDSVKIRSDHFSEVLFFYLVLISLLYILNLFNIKGNEVILINGLHSESLDLFFSFITQLGDGVLFAPVIVLIAFRSYRLAFLGISVWIAHGLLCLVLKRVIFPDFKRPAALIDNSLLHFVDGVNVHHHYSFPSGHTATIFCLAVFISLVSRNRVLAFFMLLLALAVACSRIYLLQHFLEDVLAGATVGALTSFSFYYYFTVRKFPPWMNSNLSEFFRSRFPKARKATNSFS